MRCSWFLADWSSQKRDICELFSPCDTFPTYTSNSSYPNMTILQMRCMCSLDVGSEKQAKALDNVFWIEDIINGPLTRHPTLIHRKKVPTTDTKIRFITSYHLKWNQTCGKLGQCWPIILSDPILKKYLTPNPAITARRDRNLGTILLGVIIRQLIQGTLGSFIIGAQKLYKARV